MTPFLQGRPRLQAGSPASKLGNAKEQECTPTPARAITVEPVMVDGAVRRLVITCACGCRQEIELRYADEP